MPLLHTRPSPAQVYHLMCRRGVEPSLATFGTLICIASDAGHSAKVKEAWGWLRSSGLEVHVSCANAYLQALIKEVRARALSIDREQARVWDA